MQNAPAEATTKLDLNEWTGLRTVVMNSTVANLKYKISGIEKLNSQCIQTLEVGETLPRPRRLFTLKTKAGHTARFRLIKSGVQDIKETSKVGYFLIITHTRLMG